MIATTPPPQPPVEPLTASVTVRMTRAQKDELRALSTATGRSMSAIMLDALIERLTA